MFLIDTGARDLANKDLDRFITRSVLYKAWVGVL